MNPGDNRQSDRIPATLRIRLKYVDEASFVEKYSVNVSRGGIFIATRSPKPVGTMLRFEFQLAHGEPLIRGEGAVVWVRPFDPAQPDRSHGMGVRFTRLDAESRQVIERTLAWKEQHPRPREGGEPKVPGARREGSQPAARSPDEDTRRVSLVATIAGAQPGDEPSPAEELFGPRGGEVAPPLTIELEAEEASEEELLAHAPSPRSSTEATDADDADDELEIRIEADPEPALAAAAPEERSPEEPTPVDGALIEGSFALPPPPPPAPEPTTIALPEMEPAAIAAPSNGARVRPSGLPRLEGLEEALAYLARLPSGERAIAADDPVERAAAEWAISPVRLEAALSLARGERPRGLAAGGLVDGEGELSLLLEPARPEPVPDPVEARDRIARMLAARDGAVDPDASIARTVGEPAVADRSDRGDS